MALTCSDLAASADSAGPRDAGAVVGITAQRDDELARCIARSSSRHTAWAGSYCCGSRLPAEAENCLGQGLSHVIGAPCWNTSPKSSCRTCQSERYRRSIIVQGSCHSQIHTVSWGGQLTTEVVSGPSVVQLVNTLTTWPACIHVRNPHSAARQVLRC
jgi:hypothetical protein